MNSGAPEQQHQGLQKCSEVVVSVDTGVIIKGNVSKNLKWRKITEYRRWIWGAILASRGKRKCACNIEGSTRDGVAWDYRRSQHGQPLGGAHSSHSPVHAAGARSLPTDASLSSPDTWGLGSALTRKAAF